MHKKKTKAGQWPCEFSLKLKQAVSLLLITQCERCLIRGCSADFTPYYLGAAAEVYGFL